jgi:hypothetical protein
MLLIAVLLAAAPRIAAAPRPAAGQPEPIPLAEEAQVKELCVTLRDAGGDFEGDPAETAAAQRAAQVRREEALSRWYKVEVPSKGFVFGRYRAHDKQLELDGDRPLRAVDGVLSLDLEGVDDVAFNAKPEQVSAWSKEKKAGALKLVVVFRPAADRCAGSAAAQAWRLAGKVRSWELVGARGVVAAADAEGEPVGGPPHAVRVEKVTVESDGMPLDDEGRGRLASAQRALDKCASSAQRPGTMLVSFSVQGGRVHEPQVIMDTLRDERVSDCVARAVDGAPVGGSGHGTAAVSLE